MDCLRQWLVDCKWYSDLERDDLKVIREYHGTTGDEYHFWPMSWIMHLDEWGNQQGYYDYSNAKAIEAENKCLSGTQQNDWSLPCQGGIPCKPRR